MRSCLESDTVYIDVGRNCRLYHIELHKQAGDDATLASSVHWPAAESSDQTAVRYLPYITDLPEHQFIQNCCLGQVFLMWTVASASTAAKMDVHSRPADMHTGVCTT